MIDRRKVPARQFGILLFLVLLGTAIWLTYTKAATSSVLLVFVASLCFLAISIIKPGVLYWPTRAWLGMGSLVSGPLNLIIFAFFYFCIIFPLSVAFIILGRDAMNIRARNPSSNWISVEDEYCQNEYFKRQY